MERCWQSSQQWRSVWLSYAWRTRQRYFRSEGLSSVQRSAWFSIQSRLNSTEYLIIVYCIWPLSNPLEISFDGEDVIDFKDSNFMIPIFWLKALIHIHCESLIVSGRPCIYFDQIKSFRHIPLDLWPVSRNCSANQITRFVLAVLYLRPFLAIHRVGGPKLS